MSAPESVPATASATALRLAVCPADIVELVAFRAGADALVGALRAQAVALPSYGRADLNTQRLVLCVRPDRWLLVSAMESHAGGAGVDAAWQDLIGAHGAAIDQSSGLCLLWLAGATWRAVLARGCRLDLDPRRFPAGTAAATTMAQVPVSIVPQSSGVLLLTPSTTTQHVCEWLAEAARHDGLVRQPDLPFNQLLSKEIA